MAHDKNISVLDEFKRYAYFSVRVDRYFHFVNVYGTHHHEIKSIYRSLPSPERREALAESLASEADKDLRRFLFDSASSLGYMATTNIFADDGDQVSDDVGRDASNLAFYTCYCFQWSLFEDFLSEPQMPASSSPMRSCFEPIPWRKQRPPADQPVSWWLG